MNFVTLLPYINKFLALSIILGQVLIVLTIILFFLYKKREHKFLSFMHKHVLWIGFIISLAATTFSLFYSDLVGFAPCKLCWYQRIFIYPQVLLFGFALLKRDRKIIDYCFSLSIAGLLIALYHNAIYFLPGGGAPCDASGVSCVANYVYEFGYITIPMMTLTSFALILTALLVDKIYKLSS